MTFYKINQHGLVAFLFYLSMLFLSHFLIFQMNQELNNKISCCEPCKTIKIYFWKTHYTKSNLQTLYTCILCIITTLSFVQQRAIRVFYNVKIKHLIFCIMGENAICTKQTNEDGGENRKGKTHLKGTFQLCLYFSNFCRRSEERRVGKEC